MGHGKETEGKEAENAKDAIARDYKVGQSPTGNALQTSLRHMLNILFQMHGKNQDPSPPRNSKEWHNKVKPSSTSARITSFFSTQ